MNQNILSHLNKAKNSGPNARKNHQMEGVAKSIDYNSGI